MRGHRARSIRAGHGHRAATNEGLARRRGERGFAIVEAAFVTLTFFVLVLGVIEIGLAMKDSLTVSSSVRAGARAASATGNEQRADLYTLVNISRETAAMNKADLVRVVIYKPSGFGQGPSDLCKSGASILDVCNSYTLADIKKADAQVAEETAAAAEGRTPDPSKMVFGCRTLTSPDFQYCPTRRKVDRSGTGPDYVGVWMRIEHKWVTRFFGTAKTIEDYSVIRLEPRAE